MTARRSSVVVLAARLLIVQPPRRRKRWTEADISAETEAALGRVVDQLLTLDHGRDQNDEPTSVDVEFTPEGRAAWIAFYNEFADVQAATTGDLAAAFSKLEGYAARFALVVHLIRCANDDPTLTDPDRIDERSVATAVTLARWFTHEARRIYQGFAETEEASERRELIELIRARGGEIAVRELTRSSRKYQPTERATEALDGLVKAGVGHWVSVRPESGTGPSVKTFKLGAVDKFQPDGLESKTCQHVDVSTDSGEGQSK